LSRNCSKRLFYWWAVRNDFRTPTPIISKTYEGKKAVEAFIKPKKHAINKAIKWQKMLDSGLVNSRSEIARAEGLTPARVTQVMNLLKLPREVKNFLTRLRDPKDMRKYSVRKLLSGSISVPVDQG